MPEGFTVIYATSARALARQLIGRDFADEELAAGGALDNATLHVVKKTNADELRIEIQHPWLKEQHRWMRRDAQGDLMIFNYRFYKQAGAPAGVGLDSFHRQVLGARALGVKRIETYAAGDHFSAQRNDGEVGYLVWAKFGFNALLPEKYRRLAVRTPALIGVMDLNDLMTRPGGAKWWQEFGSGLKMIFNLSPDSPMMDVFRDYLRSKGRTL